MLLFARKSAMNVKDHLKRRLPGVQLKCFKAFGNVTTFNVMQRIGFSKSLVELVDVPTKEKNAADLAMMLEIFKIAFDNPPPAYIMVITSDSDFVQTLTAVKDMGYTIILAHNENQCNDVLREASDRHCDWFTLCNGAGFMFRRNVSSLNLQVTPRVPLQPTTGSKTGAY